MRALRTRPTPPSLRMPPALKYRRGVGKIGNTKPKVPSTMAMRPMRMREWLEDLLDNSKCNGLTWVNREEKTFEIMWCHASRHDFDHKEHADLFIQYAKLTGKTDLVDGTKNVYNSKLKSNFRSALHSLNDCIQVKDAVTKGTKGENAVKIYQFIDHSHPEYKRKKLQKVKSQRNSKRSRAGKGKPTIVECAMKQEYQVQQGQTSSSEEEEEEEEEGRGGGKVEVIDDSNYEEIECSSVTIVDGSRIILPDEAEAFLLANQGNQNRHDANANCFVSVGTPVIPDIIEISPPVSPTLNTFTVPSCTVAARLRPTVTISPTPASATASAVIDRSEINVVFQQNPETFQTDLSEFDVKNTEPALPKFGALGVDDTFDSPICHANQKLSSGGSVRVRKEHKQMPQQQTFIGLGNAQFIQNQTCNVSQQDYTHIPQNVSVFDGVPQSFGHIVEQNEAVAVLMHYPEAISQGENYDLLDISGSSVHYNS